MSHATVGVAWVALLGLVREAAADQGRWVVGLRGESCHEACHRSWLRCTESVWPKEIDQLRRIADSVDYYCEDVQSGGTAYDPSAADMYCGWDGVISRHRADRTRCGAKPPAFTVRFCPCIPDPNSMPKPFDCSAGYTNWIKGWSDEKKEWCCEHETLGCTDHTTAAPFDCMAGLSIWQTGWSRAKQNHCCRNEAKGCWYQVRGFGTANMARDACMKLNGELPVLETDVEEEALKASIHAAKLTGSLNATSVWLGGSYSSSDNRWNWDNGNEIASKSMTQHALAAANGAQMPWLTFSSDGFWKESLADHFYGILCSVPRTG